MYMYLYTYMYMHRYMDMYVYMYVHRYGVATMSRILKNICLFAEYRSLL